jgi:uncharacterized repeat protein (TIGR02543 family)
VTLNELSYNPAPTSGTDNGTRMRFTGWSGACSGTSETCTVTMNADQTVVATFDQTPAVSLGLLSALRVDGRSTGISDILQDGSVVSDGRVPTAGELHFAWYWDSGGRSIHVGSGSTRLTTNTVHGYAIHYVDVGAWTIKLTSAGRALFKRSKHLKLTAVGTLQPTEGDKMTERHTITLGS